MCIIILIVVVRAPWPDSNKERKKGRNEGKEKQTNKQTKP